MKKITQRESRKEWGKERGKWEEDKAKCRSTIENNWFNERERVERKLEITVVWERKIE